jgi:hypothetical protein
MLWASSAAYAMTSRMRWVTPPGANSAGLDRILARWSASTLAAQLCVVFRHEIPESLTGQLSRRIRVVYDASPDDAERNLVARDAT